VEVVEVEHAGHPRAAPAVGGEQRARRAGVRDRLDAAVDEHREARVVRDALAGRRPPGLELHR
jgi:hypothetical protein